MACPLCFSAAVMETSHTQSPFSPLGPTNMQDGNRTQIFHQGPFSSLSDHGPCPIRVLWGCSIQEDALSFPHTLPGRNGCIESVFSHQAAPHFSIPSIARLTFT